MKQHLKYALVIFSLLILCSVITTTVTAQTATTSASLTPTPTSSSAVDKQINDLKQRIASKVAQLKLVERRGLLGKVTDVSNSQIAITDSLGNARYIDVDELTKFSSPSAKESFGISDISKGVRIGTLGLYNKQSQRLLARFVDIIVTPTRLHGIISNVDTENFTLKMITDDNTQQTIDIQSITKTSSYTKDAGVIRVGFSKIKLGEHIMIIGYPDTKNPNLFVASRIILFPDLPKNPKIKAINLPTLPPLTPTATEAKVKSTTP